MNRQLFTMWPRIWLALLCMAGTLAARPDMGKLVFYLPCEDAANPIDASADPATVVLLGSLTSVPGQFGTKALGFNGNNADRVVVSDTPKLEGMSALTVEAWVLPRKLASYEGMCVAVKRSGIHVDESYALWVWTGQFVYGRINGSGTFQSKRALEDDVWYHLALVFDGQGAASEKVKLYINGVLEVSGSHADTSVKQAGAPLWIGGSDPDRGFPWDGVLDEIGIWNTALTAEEIGQLMVQSKAGLFRTGTAGNPQPADGALHSDNWVILSWTPGYSAASHDVYLGDNFDDVNGATLDSETFRGNQAGTYFVAGFPGFPYPDGLVPGTTYYWRVDEVNNADPNSPWKGNVWSFSIPPKTAYDPVPADGSKLIGAADTTLSWTPGFGARLHTIYFGNDFETVNSAVGGIPVALATYKPGPLEIETTYYWRVDEYDGITTYKGDIWKFTVSP